MAEIPLQVVTADMAILSYHDQSLILRPAEALDLAFIPGYASQLLSCLAVDFYRWLGRLSRLI